MLFSSLNASLTPPPTLFFPNIHQISITLSPAHDLDIHNDLGPSKPHPDPDLDLALGDLPRTYPPILRSHQRLCITGSPKNKSKATHSIHKLSTSFDLVGPLAIEDIKPEKIADLLAKASQQETRDVVLDAYLSQGRVWDAFTAHEIVTATKSFDSTRVSTESEVDDSADDTCNRSIFSKLMCKPLKIQPSLALTVNPNTATPAFESNIVVKLTSPDVNPTNDRDRVEEITREAWIYEHVLKPLQGDIVPRFYGVFAGIHRVWKTPWFSDAGHWEEMLIFAAVMEHAGETASERDVKRMATSERYVQFPSSQLRY